MSALTPPEIILRPVVSEKSIDQSTRGRYTFQVHPKANKIQIKAAVEELFNVRVEAVRTQNHDGKKTRFRTSEGKQPDWKKAIVTLNDEDRIELF